MNATTEERQFDLRGRSVFLAIPCYDGKICATGAFAIAQLALMLPGYGVALQMAHLSGCSVISKARNSLVQAFMESGCTDLLFIDADVRWDPNDIIRLLGWASEKDVVGGVIPTRRPNAPYIATLLEDEQGRFKLDRGLVEARHLGTAFMMIRRHVFEKLIAEHPEWAYRSVHGDENSPNHYSIFDFKSSSDGYIGEDYNFCDRVRAAGMRVFIDPDIKLDHYGTWEFKGDFGRDVIYKALRGEDGK